MYLFFDTETSGLPKTWNAPVSDLKNWPRLVQLAWILCDEMGNRITQDDFIIKPEGFKITKGAMKIHGITTKRAMDEGEDLKLILDKFNELVSVSKCIVAHNIRFDKNIIGAEFLRKKIATDFFGKKKLCTMLSSTTLCKLPGNYGYKWPKLTELHYFLFKKGFEGAHDAFADIDATEKCFWKLRKRGLI